MVEKSILTLPLKQGWHYAVPNTAARLGVQGGEQSRRVRDLASQLGYGEGVCWQAPEALAYATVVQNAAKHVFCVACLL